MRRGECGFVGRRQQVSSHPARTPHHLISSYPTHATQHNTTDHQHFASLSASASTKAHQSKEAPCTLHQGSYTPFPFPNNTHICTSFSSSSIYSSNLSNRSSLDDLSRPSLLFSPQQQRKNVTKSNNRRKQKRKQQIESERKLKKERKSKLKIN